MTYNGIWKPLKRIHLMDHTGRKRRQKNSWKGFRIRSIDPPSLSNPLLHTLILHIRIFSHSIPSHIFLVVGLSPSSARELPLLEPSKLQIYAGRSHRPPSCPCPSALVLKVSQGYQIFKLPQPPITISWAINRGDWIKRFDNVHLGPFMIMSIKQRSAYHY